MSSDNREICRMKIVVLDGYTLNPGDLSWKALEALGDCSVYDRLAPEEVIPRAIDAEVILTNTGNRVQYCGC